MTHKLVLYSGSFHRKFRCYHVLHINNFQPNIRHNMQYILLLSSEKMAVRKMLKFGEKVETSPEI